MNDNVCFVGTEASRPVQVSLLSAFDEIAQTVLKAAKGEVYTSLRSYLDGGVAIGGASFSRRAILLAIHDMKDDLEAPLALRETTHAALLWLKVRPTPKLELYRDIATALLRMEVVIRLTAIHALENGATKH